MNRRRVIIVLTGVFYLLQLALIAYWHSLAEEGTRMLDLAISVGIAVVIGLIDAAVARYLLQALRRAETAYAADVSERLEQSLESYRVTAEREDALAQEVGSAVELELAAARRALAEGRVGDLDHHLQHGLDIASQTRASYCENVTVAAVLETKVRQCEEAGVRLVPQVVLPNELGLPDVDVAAVFFNLIDNALHECVALVAEGVDEPTIVTKARVQAGQLFVSVENPCRADVDAHSKARAHRAESGQLHGWGTEIVASIAQDHGGIAEFEAHDGTFVANVMIPLHALPDE